jgi:hypothetical protein
MPSDVADKLQKAYINPGEAGEAGGKMPIRRCRDGA